MDRNRDYPRYILITPARNEESFIEKTVESVIQQTVLPTKWVIVNDGSTDKTPEVVNRYLAHHSWIEMVNLPPQQERNFAAKVRAFNAGLERVKFLDYDIMGNLDADLSFEADYFEFLLGKFMEDESLGVSGTVFKEDGYSSERHSFEGHNHVAGGCQLFRRVCFEEIGGFISNRAGGVDWIAVTTARMRGWKTRSFRQKSFFHHRHLGQAERGALASTFSYGEKDYYLGNHPVWEMFRVAYRMTKRPYMIAGMVLGLGYASALLRRIERPVSKELVRFHRQEQMQKLRTILKTLMTFKRVDNFSAHPKKLTWAKVEMVNKALVLRVASAAEQLRHWLDGYGETSYDHQSFFAGALGRRAKALYYRRPLLGTVAVAPMIFFEAFLPSARRLFWKPQRFPIADAHYAMGFAFLAETYGVDKYHRRAVHFLEVLQESRCPGYEDCCWGYPFGWQTRNGTIAADTPLITTLPYVYEAFSQVYAIDRDTRWLQIMRSIAKHALMSYRDMDTAPGAASCTYTPAHDDSCGVINASAYRAFLLTKAGIELSEPRYLEAAKRNLNFVLGSQNADGSWFYAMDGERTFVDHFHTCFVLKALAKIEQLTPGRDCKAAIERGISYYVKNLFDAKGLPRPFSQRPRLTVYRRELYDCAECINLAVLLYGRFPELDRRLSNVVTDLLNRWQKPDGSFRSRELLVGWDNVPMHRWAQAQLFRSLCFLLSRNLSKPELNTPAVHLSHEVQATII